MTTWTDDELSTPRESEVVEEIFTSVCCYRLMHDTDPKRWYVVRIVLDGMGIRPNGEIMRTPVYSSRNAPALHRLWSEITEMKAVLRGLEDQGLDSPT